ncbi:MAG: hypothetical protein IT305_23965 [Chloroflexi bacterium]|nr:hypothetical protein [Chloroflexota bacterium]
MQRFPDLSVRPILTGIFRQAIALHRAVGVQGYLGAPPSNPRDVSITLKNLFLCAATRGRDCYLLVDNVPGLQEVGTWRGFKLSPCPSAPKQQLAWISCKFEERPVLEAILTDGDVWRAYRRMLQRIMDVNRSDRPATLQRLSVLA